MALGYDPYNDDEPYPPLPHEAHTRRERDGEFDPKAHADELQKAYGIRPTMSLRQRVSLLYENFDYRDLSDIVSTLRLEPDQQRQAAVYLKDAEADVEAAGREQTPAEIARHKGFAIRRLERMRADLEAQIPVLPADKISAVANQIKGIEAQVLSLRGANQKPQAKDEGPEFGAELVKRIAALPTERIAELRARMPKAA